MVHAELVYNWETLSEWWVDDCICHRFVKITPFAKYVEFEQPGQRKPVIREVER